MKKRKSNLVFLAAVALLSICLTSETEAADWDIVAAPGSEQITTPTPETTNNSYLHLKGQVLRKKVMSFSLFQMPLHSQRHQRVLSEQMIAQLFPTLRFFPTEHHVL
ncbi:MAG: hypothetical protein ACTIDI_04540 [Pseudolactococcus laudensis]